MLILSKRPAWEDYKPLVGIFKNNMFDLEDSRLMRWIKKS